MQQFQLIRTIAAAIVMAGAAGTASQADVFRDIGLGLAVAGFNVEGGRNIASGGFDLLINRNFNTETIDAGVAELTLQGPISLEFSTGRRLLPVVDLSFQTALASDLAPQPLNYAFNFDVGGQRTEVIGNIFVDGNLSMNGFGFYDVDLTYSSRQNVERDGRFSNSQDEYDFDVGPVHIRGNIFADVLGLLTAPVFDSAGTFNPFLSFSGHAQLQNILDEAEAGALRELAVDGDPFAAVQLAPATAPIAFPTPNDALRASGGSFVGSAVTGANVTPEPSVLALMLLGLPVLLRRARKVRRPA